MDWEEAGFGRLVAAAALVCLTLFTAMGGIELATASDLTAAWWPAGGVAVIALLTSPRHWWPVLYAALFVAYLVAGVRMGRPTDISFGLALGQLAETALASQLIVRYVGRTLRQVQHIWWLLLIAVEAACLAGLGVALTSALLMGGPLWQTAGTTAITHAASLIVVVPLAMAPGPVERFSRVQLLAQLACLAVVAALTFGPSQRVNLAFALYPLMIWAAVSFGARMVAFQQLALAAAVTGASLAGWGELLHRAASLPFGLGAQVAHLYVVSLAVTALPLALAMRQRSEVVEIVAARERSFRTNFISTAIPTALLSFDGTRLTFDEVNVAAAKLLHQRSRQVAGVDADKVLTGSVSLAIEAHDLVAGHEASWFGVRNLADEPSAHIEISLALIGRTDGRHQLSMTLHDVTDEQRVQRQLAAEQEYNKAFTDSSPSPVIVIDTHGTVLMANPAATAISGFTEEELVGRPMWETIVPPDRRVGVSEHFADGEPIPTHGESLISTADGRTRQVIFASSVLAAGIASEQRHIITATDVTDVRQTSQLMTHLLTSATTVAFLGTDVEGRITLFNQGASEMLGVAPETAVGRYFVEFLDPADVARHARAMRLDPGFAAVVAPITSTGAPDTSDWAWLAVTGARVQVSMTASRMVDNLGSTLGFFFVARDVSDTRRSQAILVQALDRERQAVAQLKSLDAARDDFISTVSHELRTPMTSIIGSAEMLMDGTVGVLEERQRALLEVIERNGDRLLALADDLLVLAQNDAAGWAETLVRLDLRNIMRESHASVASLRNRRTLTVSADYDGEPVEVYGDVQKLERAVTNLLSNAIKFTPDGGTITTRVSRDPTNGTARLLVADTGLGIAESELERVFERFYRSTNVEHLAIQGTGLGLPIVKEIVESHRGRIQVRSRPGAGTRFTIELPLAAAR